MKRKLVHILILGLGASLSLPTAALAQPAPGKNLRFIIPFSAGGGLDVATRVVLQRAEKELGTTIVIENRGGAGGTLGTGTLARAEPDGSTFGVITASHAINPWLYKSLPYDSVRDFAPVTLMVNATGMLVVNPSLPIRTVRELIDYAKANPGKLDFSSSGGNGTPPHLAGELFKSLTGISMQHVPYKGHEAFTDLIAGRVSLSFPTITGGVMGYIKNGKLRPIAVTGATRSPQFPDLPTVAESGVPGFDLSSQWYGVVAPAGTPAAAIHWMREGIVRALHSPEVQAKFAPEALEVVAGTPDEFASHLKSEIERWGVAARAANIKLE